MEELTIEELIFEYLESDLEVEILDFNYTDRITKQPIKYFDGSIKEYKQLDDFSRNTFNEKRVGSIGPCRNNKLLIWVV